MGETILQAIRNSGFCFEELAARFPVFDALKQVQQHREYHGEGDVYTHTKMVCEEVIKLSKWPGLSGSDQEILYLSAAFHDIGKLPATKLEDGKWTSPKHTIIGARMFRELAYREAEKFGLTFWQREKVALMIRYHGLPVWFWSKKRPEYDLIKAAEQVDLLLLYLLSKADTRGRISQKPDELAHDVEYFSEYAEETGVLGRVYPFSNPFTRFQYFQKKVDWPGADLYDTTEFDVFVLCGLPLSGKDTWIEKQGGIKVISLDSVREEFKLSPSKGSAKAADIATKRARELLRRKEPFIWNATNIIEETRQKVCSLCSSYGARVHFIYLEAPYEELLKRNRKRERDIPENVLENMIRKFEPPAPWEGYSVRYLTDGDDN